MTDLRRPATAALALSATLALTGAAAAEADAGAASARHGSLTLALTAHSKAAAALRAPGLRLTAAGGARVSAKKLVLPVASGRVTAKRATVKLGGTVSVRAGRSRRLTLRGLAATFGDRGRLTVRAAGARVTLFTIVTRRALSLNAAAGTAKLTRAAVSLTKAGAARLRHALRVPALVAGRVGSATLTAQVAGGSGATRPGGGGSGSGGDGGGSGGGGGTGGGGGNGASPTTPSTPGTPTSEPPLLARPATAVDVTSATITWHPRESFIQYINTGEGTVTADGATADPPSTAPGSDARLAYSFHFPFSDGWYDPASGTAGLSFGGTVGFRYQAHGIQLDVKRPEVELTGAASRVIARFAGGESTNLGDRRGVLETLDPSRAASVTQTGSTFTYTQVPGAIPAGAADSVFAGYYLPGDPFGWVTVTFTVG
jgi:hypothetical protein